MFERFSQNAREVVVDAQEEARDLAHGYIGTEHLLYGLATGEGTIAAEILTSLGVTPKAVETHIIRVVGRGEQAIVGQIPMTPRCKKVLELALREALSLGHNYIGTEHVLLGLVREGAGVAARILEDVNVTDDILRNAVIRRLSESRPTPDRPYRSNEQGRDLEWRLRRAVGLINEATKLIDGITTDMRSQRETI